MYLCTMQARLVYEANPKHKRGAAGEGPPRWFPDSASLCPDDITQDIAQTLLDKSISAADAAHPSRKARFAMHAGCFYKAYPTEQSSEVEIWHGYPVRRELVNRQIPARVLRTFVKSGALSKAEYKRLLGNAP